MEAISLQSGSNGNCIYVEASGTRLLVDAGISGIQAQKRLAGAGRDIRQVDAVLISHDHADHVRCAGVYSRKFGLPVWMTARTARAAASRGGPGRIPTLRTFRAGETLEIGGLAVETVPTPHDAADGVAFVVAANGVRLGVLTDLGHVFDGLRELIDGLDGVFIESNYDPRMLEEGPYPAYLKARIRGPGGHLSNQEAANLIAGAAAGRLAWACLSHLSENNNTPETAMAAARRVLGHAFDLDVAGRYAASRVFDVRARSPVTGM